ncbi:MAG TPA: OmpA family protein [Bryobacteraceae bacterium]
MKSLTKCIPGWRSAWPAVSAAALLTASLAFAVTPNAHSFNAGEKAQLNGIIVSRQGNMLKLRGDDNAISTVELNAQTKIQMKHGMFGWGHKAMAEDSLLPGLSVKVQGKGNQQGDLVAKKVVFNPNSMAASREIDTRVSPIEARQGQIENRTNKLASRTDQLADAQTQLQDQQKQTEQHVGQVQQQAGAAQTAANQANEGVGRTNHRISALDNYVSKDKVDVQFHINRATLSSQAKQQLDQIAQETQGQKGYMLQVEGFADRTGPAKFNQRLSQERADAVVRYLEQHGNIPIYRILQPTGMGTTHPLASHRASRRVEVTLLINQGVAGGSQTSENGGTGMPNTASHSVQ